MFQLMMEKLLNIEQVFHLKFVLKKKKKERKLSVSLALMENLQ
jgi:hypothetical protein